METRPRIALGLTLLLAACIGQTGEPAGGAQADGGAGAGADAAPGGSAGLEILPKKIYSGFDGVAVYRAPILARGGTDLTWSVADPSLAQLMPEAGGTQLMILTLKAGTTRLTVSGNGKSATADLIITQYTPTQRATGEARYGTAQGGDPACASCHAGFTGPDHTPTLLEVDSDAQIVNTFLTGIDAEGNPIPTARHAWNVTEPQKLGLVAYMRSLAPRGYPDPDHL
jgi:hypothetical protein